MNDKIRAVAEKTGAKLLFLYGSKAKMLFSELSEIYPHDNVDLVVLIENIMMTAKNIFLI